MVSNFRAANGLSRRASTLRILSTPRCQRRLNVDPLLWEVVEVKPTHLFLSDQREREGDFPLASPYNASLPG